MEVAFTRGLPLFPVRVIALSTNCLYAKSKPEGSYELPSGSNPSQRSTPMQRADEAGSTRSRCASCGNDARNSGHEIDLIAFPIDEFHRESNLLSYDLGRAKTLLQACAETLAEATDDKGFWSRDAAYHRDRLEHVRGLVMIVEDMVLSAITHMDAGDEVFARSRRAARQKVAA